MHPELPDSLSLWLESRRQSHSHRQLLVIAGPESWGQNIAESLIKQQAYASVLWSGHRQLEDAISHNLYRHYLGMEFDAVVYNAHSGVRANAMISLSGTVKANNLMLLLCPSFEDWPTQADPERHQRTSYGFKDNTESAFVHRLVNCITSDKSVAILSQEDFSGTLCTVSHSSNRPGGPIQADAVDAIVNHTGHPIVITADRGRGKSSALGMASAHLMKQQEVDVLVTAPNRKAVDKVFEHAQKNLTATEITKNQIVASGSELSFQAIDAILESQPHADILLIDEAAAIPNNLLKQLVNSYERVVLSSTVHGYEGSGRGFELRFKQYLSQQYPLCQMMHLNAPIRWSQGDVLEQFWFDAMLMKAKSNNTLAESRDSNAIEIRQVGQQELLKNTQRLSEMFALLIDAHYQTTPDDLKRLLDAPDIVLFVAKAGNSVVGVMVLNKEGGEKLADIAPAISNGTRRPPGHLVAQQMAYSYAKPQLATLSYLRVTRIAVSHVYQRHGIASRLLSAASQMASNEDMDFVVTSFGLNPTLLAFWEHNHFQPVKLSTQKDASSGELSLIMLQSANGQSTDIREFLLSEFQQELLYQIDYKDLDLPAEIVSRLKEAVVAIDATGPSYKGLLKQFAEGLRPLNSCERCIHQFLNEMDEEVIKLCQSDYRFLRDCVSAKKSRQTLIDDYKLTGKKALTQQARFHLASLLEKVSAS